MMREEVFWNSIGAALIAGAFAMASAGQGHAQALDDCACVVPATALPGTDSIGQLVEVDGNVMLTSTGGPQVALPGASLRSGDLVTVGPQSSAFFEISDCSLQLAANTEMILMPAEGQICVAVSDVMAQHAVDQGSSLQLDQNAPLALFGGTILWGGATALIFGQGDDVPVSP